MAHPSAKQKAFVKGMVKGTGALGVGLAAKLITKVATGAAPTVNLNAVNPLAGPAGVVGFFALLGGLGVSGAAEAEEHRKHSEAQKIVGYALMAVVGASLDPEQEALPVPRQLTQNPTVAAQYAGWIPYYAPGTTFPIVVPTPPTTRVTDVYTQVPRFNNVF